ncbi:MAG: LCP family protein [Candidatus Falkowbacteria bacterium]
MAELDLDFKEKIDADEARRAKLLRKKEKLAKIFYVFGFLIAVYIIFSITMIITGDSSETWYERLPIVGQLFSDTANKQVMGESDDRINILLMGMGDKGHDGAYLTDTMILASLKPSTKEVVLFSIPRDMWVKMPDGGYGKINSINAYAEKNHQEGGLVAMQAVSEMFELPIQYYVRVDFSGFVNIVDELGGVTVDVENTFDDYTYPAAGQEDNPDYYARFEHLHFDKGVQTMNGTTALKYTRSRHALGPEGSDFARGKRQQKVIAAVKEKLLQKSNLLHPGMLASIAMQLKDHFATNVSIVDGLKIWSLFKEAGKDKIHSESFDNSPGNFLHDSVSAAGAYILLPSAGNFSKMTEFIKNIFDTLAPSQLDNAELKIDTPASVEIKNGTNISGLAATVSEKLKTANFDVSAVSNSSKRDFSQAVIYDLTYGDKPEALNVLKTKLGALVETNLPEWLLNDIKTDIKNNPSKIRPDFILILGQNNNQTTSTTLN